MKTEYRQGFYAYFCFFFLDVLKALPLVEKLKEVVKKSDYQMRAAYEARKEADR